VPCYVGFYIYKHLTHDRPNGAKNYFAAIAACVFAICAGALLVPIEAAASGVLVVPLHTFLITMLGVHVLIGIVEGLITATVLAFLAKVRPAVIDSLPPGPAKLSKPALYATLAIFTVIIAAGLSLLASEMPDGLEWSYAERPNQPGFKSLIENKSPKTAVVDNFQARYSPMPDYSARQSQLGQTPDSESQEQVSAGWTSFAGVAGAGLTMTLIWLTAGVLKRKRPGPAAS